MRRVGFWILDNVPMGSLAPYWFGMLIGRWPRRVAHAVPAASDGEK